MIRPLPLRRWAPLTAGLALAACAAEDAPPDDLSEPTAWLLHHFDDADDDVLDQVAGLADYADDIAPDAADATPPATYTPDPLDPAQLALPWTPAAPDAAPAARIAVALRSDHDVDDHRQVAFADDRACLLGVATASREAIDGGACFGPGGCDDALAEDDVTEPFDGGTRRLLTGVQLRTEVLDDDREVLFARHGRRDDGATWYAVEVVAESALDPRRAVRLVGLWSDGPVDAEVDAVVRRHRAVEAWLDQGGCPPGS